jgi:hypothetical protein
MIGGEVKPVTDDAVREVHGCRCRNGAGISEVVHAIEGDQYITLGAGLREVRLTPWQARYLAAKLYRLARRIKQRTDAAALIQQMEGREA